jgi:hypothetical protein
LHAQITILEYQLVFDKDEGSAFDDLLRAAIEAGQRPPFVCDLPYWPAGIAAAHCSAELEGAEALVTAPMLE